MELDRQHTSSLLGDRAIWRDPQLVSLNRLPMRSPLVPCPDVDTARLTTPAVTEAGARSSSPWFSSLDGTWRFAFYDRPEDVPLSDVDPRTDDSGWDQIAVPGNWTVQGWDRPHYTNIFMPFDLQPPEVPDANPTGVYRKEVTVPSCGADVR